MRFAFRAGCLMTFNSILRRLCSFTRPVRIGRGACKSGFLRSGGSWFLLLDLPLDGAVQMRLGEQLLSFRVQTRNESCWSDRCFQVAARETHKHNDEQTCDAQVPGEDFQIDRRFAFPARRGGTVSQPPGRKFRRLPCGIFESL
jgi:hypothetical protein